MEHQRRRAADAVPGWLVPAPVSSAASAATVTTAHAPAPRLALLRSGTLGHQVRDRPTLVGESGDKDAVLIEYLRRLVLDREGRPDPSA